MEPQLIDTHAHVNFKAFVNDAPQVIQQCLDAGIWMINVGSQLATSTRAAVLTQHFPEGVFAAVGKHPTHVDNGEGFPEEQYAALIQEAKGKVVAIGETGLDTYRVEGDPTAYLDRQRALFLQEVALAKHFDLPVIIHGRGPKGKLDAIYEDLFALVNSVGGVRGVLHCYVGSWEAAKPFVDAGFSVSFTGIVTFKNAPEVQETARQIPLDRLMLETDSPYLAPEPVRGAERNTPLNVAHIADFIAQLRQISPAEIRSVTTANARKFFHI